MDAATLTAMALVITAIGSIISAVATFYNIAISKRAVVVSEANSVHMQKVEAATNGLSAALSQSKLEQGTAEGMAIGLERGRNETK